MIRYLPTCAILVLALATIIVRGLHRKCWFFAVNLGVVSGCGLAMILWPGTFYTRDFYALSRDVQAGLKLCIALEVGYHVFRSFPRAFDLARWGALLVLIVTAAGVASHSPWLGWSDWSVSRAGLNAGTVWLFGGMGLLVIWYNLPLDKWHGTIIGGYTAYLLLSTVLLAREGLWRSYAATLDPFLAGWWAWSAWNFGRVKVTASEPLTVRA